MQRLPAGGDKGLMRFISSVRNFKVKYTTPFMYHAEARNGFLSCAGRKEPNPFTIINRQKVAGEI